ncbi:MAG: hypothetical protein PHV34_01220 [Verrucomicrobiae bacterium]|nr:hypothetical protein [Verrucomicrobiae bacterium]
MNAFAQLLEIKGDAVCVLQTEQGRLAVCPDMGGRVFAELAGQSLHRLHLDTVRDPTQAFNNFGGSNFWPAPEGGAFGFNYKDGQWYVQPAINQQPFEVRKRDSSRVFIEKRVCLANCRGKAVEALMSRETEIAPLAPILKGVRLKAAIACQTTDTFSVLKEVSADDALLASWNLEQFDTTEHTLSFCAVANPREAINFDFYQHPGEKISWLEKGFTYRTDGRRKGQIGIRKAAKPSFIGFCNLSRNLLVIKENRSNLDGLFFNIADNEQSQGPYSAADVYSIFTSDPDMKAFELETIAPLRVEDGKLKSSELVSITTHAFFEETADMEAFLKKHLG